MSRSTMTMRELRKLTAGAIQALEGPMTITSGGSAIALLYPILKAPRPFSEVRRSIPKARQLLIDKLERRKKEFDAKTSPEERARYDRFLAEIGE
jgi:antitoxin (DNA-binding transcriptional repressor) of toxin-antitoxin stability system